MKNTICLSMIVKNESHVIYKTLQQIIKYIPLTYIVICDTGSVDNTIQVINNFLTNNKIPGEIHKHEWVDFATNRNLALNISRTKADYSFFFDADDIFHLEKGKFDFPNELTSDFYRFKFDKNLTYMRPLLINNKKDIKWYGVVHECLKPNENITICNILGNYYIESGHTGDRNKNEFKFLKDAFTIEREIKRIENKKEENYSKDDIWLLPRYYFYCAQSYGDFYNKDPIYKPKVIEYYTKALNYDKVISIDEKYFCCYRLYILENNIKYLIESFKYDKNYRIECVIEYMKYLYSTKNYKIIKDLYYKYNKYHEIKDLHSNNLFLLQHYYNYKLEYIYTLTADKLYDYEEGLKCCNLCIENNINVEQCKNNSKIYNIKLLKDDSLEKSNKILIFTLFPEQKMNYSYFLNNAIGGSETAIYNMATQIAKKFNDKEVVIAGNIDEEEIIINDYSIKCINIVSLKKLIMKYKFDTIIISRYLNFFEIFPYYQCDNLILYQHDVHFLPDYKKSYNLLKSNINKIDHIINLTEWQKNNTVKLYDFLKEYDNKFKIINNGIDLEKIKIHENNKKYRNSFIYTSRPERGLKKVLELWKEIKENLPNATLKISSYNSLGEEYMNIIKNLKDVYFLGQLNKDDLYKHISQSEYWLYPTSWQETSCITAMEMLALKVICIYYPLAGLNDTIGKHGVKITPGNEVKTILNLSDNIKFDLRNNGFNYSKTLSWNNQSDKLINIIGKNFFFKTLIVNLKHNIDRKNNIIQKLQKENFYNFEFYNAVNGKKIVENKNIYELFKDNNFRYNKSVIGCFYSHYNIWKQLIKEKTIDFYIIFEDDISLCNNFKKRFYDVINYFKNNNLNFIYLGKYNDYSKFNNNSNFINVPKEYINNNKFADGTFGYIIHKKLANYFINFINNNSVRVGVDHFINLTINQQYITYLKDDLVKADPNSADSNIRKCNDYFFSNKKFINNSLHKNIPNICHFIFGLKEQINEFKFCYYLSVYSAFKINNPECIYFYYHHEPYGKWWEKLKEIKNIKFQIVDIPTYIGKKKILKTAHKADVLRLIKLNEIGGIYLDIDTICVKNWNFIINNPDNNTIIGKEHTGGICNAIIMSKPNSTFIQTWLLNYEKTFQPNGWRESSIELPEKLISEINNYNNIFTLFESDVFFLPNFNETYKIFEQNQEIPKNLISLHLWDTFSHGYINQINNWEWAYENSHTMYGKILLNLIDNYILNNNYYYFANKSCFIKKDNYLICNKSTFLKKTLKYSSESEKNLKIILKIDDKVRIINNFNDSYYIVSTEIFNWISQKDQDYWVIHEIFDYKKNGFFVDLASTNGKDINNTYLLEKNFNWNGICIEPNLIFHGDLYKNRKCYISHEIVGDKNDKKVKFRIDAGGCSGIINKKYDNQDDNCKFIVKNTTTLENILDKFNAPKIIDYLSLDVEGGEYNILKNFPFNKYIFLSLTIEGPSQLLDILLFENDYLFVRKSKKLNNFDSYYIHKSLLNSKIKFEPYSLSLRRTHINRNKNLPKLHIIYRIDKNNTGDMVSNCSEYYSFEDYKIIKHDIYSPDFNIIKKDDPIILSGGGLLNCIEIWNKNINKLLELSKNVFGWGIGFNKHNNTNIITNIDFSKFKLLGLRDYKQIYNNNEMYVPCSSCNLPQIKYEYKIKRNIGIIEHHHHKILLKYDYDKINNEIDIDNIIKFIGESNIIITNSYHALYFSALLDKKCVLYNRFSEKYDYTKFCYIKYEDNLDLNNIKNMNSNILQDSIKINNKFYSYILSNIS